MINGNGKGDGPVIPQIVETPLPNQPPFITSLQKSGSEGHCTMDDYWRKALADCECAPFPALPPSAGQPKPDSAMVHQLPRLQGQYLGITQSTINRAAWALVVSRMTDSDDVVFGATVSGKSPLAVTTIVPVRIQLDRNQTVSNYLEEIQQQTTDMIPFQQIELPRITRVCPFSKACMFQTLLVIQPQGSHEQQQSGPYSLVLEIEHDKSHATATAIFDSRVVSHWMVKLLLDRLEFVVRQLDCAGPEQRIADVEVVTKSDLEQIWEWNGTVPAPVERCVHGMIEEPAQDQLASPAVCAWAGKLTAKFIASYASSECTICNAFNYSAPSPDGFTGIGQGLGVVTWVVDLDNHNSLLPLGCIGELLIEGPPVGLGYLDNPEDNAAAFIDDPAWLLHGFQGRPERPGRHGKLYKTGDLVYYNEDGSLTFIGRKDERVKVCRD
ncbi:hypothetical protein EDB80DRAFT_414918 [Ilyonectria destructans]|nr:hypothetical protein EDB80DRAFT_414918 [Ilyonectria destructans]